MKIALTLAERDELKCLHRQQQNLKYGDRIKAILLSDSGYSRKEIAEILLRDEGTITEWQNSFLTRESLSEWLKDNNAGYQGLLSEEQLTQVECFVESSLIQDARQVRDWIHGQYDIVYSITGIHALLHRLGFKYKETTSFPCKMDPVEQADFKEFYEDCLENLPANSVLGFIDGVHPQHNTKTTKAWIKEGEKKFIPSNTGRKRLNINGFYDPLSQEGVFLESETLNTQSSLAFFRKLEQSYPTASSIYAICDKAPYYFNTEVQTYLEGSRVELIFLPTYSPNLNLIERLWKFMRKEVINTKFYEKFKDFKAAVTGFLENLADYKDELKSFVGVKLHLFNPFPA